MSLTKEDRIIRSFAGRSLQPERYATAIARALHREYDGMPAAIKTVVELTGANERAVKNWFEARNGPSGEFLIALCRHSNEVLDTVLLLAGRRQHLKARKLLNAKQKLHEILITLAEMESE